LSLKYGAGRVDWFDGLSHEHQVAVLAHEELLKVEARQTANARRGGGRR
jgi:hypothetical protein